LRVSFAGGGTDLPEFSDVHGGAVLSATIKRYAHCELTYNGELSVNVKCDAPPGSGLGGSSSVCVAIIRAMDARLGIERSKHDLAEAAYVMERKHLRIAGGKQDQYAAAFGGLNLIEFPSKKEAPHANAADSSLTKEVIQVSPVVLPDQTREALQRSLVLVHTGAARTHAGIQKRLAENVGSQFETMMILKGQAFVMTSALLNDDLEKFGRHLHYAWNAKKRSSNCTTERADILYAAAMDTGAWGGKLCGAGLGGYLLLCVPEERRLDVMLAMERLDCRPEAVEFDDEGATVEQQL
jgi:D-glycero-alpha-D-manno-heptose-7-phosphate kinase